MRLFIALLIGKLITLIGKPLHKASNLPGEIALKFDPSLLKKFNIEGKIIAVTGSNGKTSSANLISHILTNCGYKVVNNAQGSNMTGGVATSLINSSDFKGNVKCDYVVLEVDERFSRFIFKDINVDYLLITNLFRDQLTRNGNVDIIFSILTSSINENTKIIANGNDPISTLLKPNNPKVFYALDENEYSQKESLNITHDAKVCPKCFHKLKYDYFHYNHIGKFRCDYCGYENKDIKYLAKDADYKNGSITLLDRKIDIVLKTPFNYLNTAGAVATCLEVGLNIDDVAKGASSFKPLKERFDEFNIDNRKAYMILSKNQNPVSFDQSIDYYLSNEKGTIIAYINNINHTNNKDTTWLYDISFERLKGNVNNIICSGPRAYDLAVRLKLAKIDEDKIIVETDLSKINEAVKKTSGNIYILTELYDAKAIVKAAGKK